MRRRPAARLIRALLGDGSARLWRRGRTAQPLRNNTSGQLPDMTVDELRAWGERHDKVLIEAADFDRLCERTAGAAASLVDFDRDFERLFGTA